jgi:hypothetical protein
MVGIQDPHSPNRETTLGSVSAMPAPRFLVLLGYGVWVTASIVSFAWLVASGIASLDSEPISVATRGRFAFMAVVAAVLSIHCVRRLRAFSRLHPLRRPISSLE